MKTLVLAEECGKLTLKNHQLIKERDKLKDGLRTIANAGNQSSVVKLQVSHKVRCSILINIAEELLGDSNVDTN